MKEEFKKECIELLEPYGYTIHATIGNGRWLAEVADKQALFFD